MSSLTKDDMSLVDEVNTPNRVEMCTAARLYVVQESEWMFTGLTGAVALVHDEKFDTYFLRLIDLDLRSVVWEQEFYDNFQYFKSTGWLHTLECDLYVAGLSFASVPESKIFWEALLQAKNGGGIFAEGKKKDKDDGKHNMKAKADMAKKKVKGAFKFSKKGVTTMGKKIGSVFEKEEKEELIISGPRNFRHSSHIGWNSDEGFKIRDIPEAWKRIFKASGIKKSELKDKETAAYIMDVIANTMGVSVDEIGEAPPSNLAGGSGLSQSGGFQVATVVTNAPPPPPPPMMMNHTHPPGLTPPPPGGMQGTAPAKVNIFDQIKQGTALKEVKADSSNPPPGGGSLADTLAAAMANRRGAVDSDSGGADEWSESD